MLIKTQKTARAGGFFVHGPSAAVTLLLMLTKGLSWALPIPDNS
jgi:hypothetical protein